MSVLQEERKNLRSLSLKQKNSGGRIAQESLIYSWNINRLKGLWSSGYDVTLTR